MTDIFKVSLVVIFTLLASSVFADMPSQNSPTTLERPSNTFKNNTSTITNATTNIAANTATAFKTNVANMASNATYLKNNAFTMVKDTAVTSYIYAKLATHPNLSSLNIDVSTHDGVVTLNGLVDTDNEANAIIKVAESTSGVNRVDGSKMIIARNNPPPTNAIEVASFVLKKKTTPAMQEASEDEGMINANDPILTSPKTILKEKMELAQNTEKSNEISRNVIIGKKHSTHHVKHHHKHSTSHHRKQHKLHSKSHKQQKHPHKHMVRHHSTL